MNPVIYPSLASTESFAPRAALLVALLLQEKSKDRPAKASGFGSEA
jgi:hypothetical protein